MQKNNLCKVPFGFIEIFSNGNVFTCCEAHIKDGCIGNIFENPFDEILNSDKAIKIRENALNNDYSMCNLKLCQPNKSPFAYQLNSPYVKNISYTKIIDKPNIIKFSYDSDCNVKCITCRDNIIRNSEEKIQELNDKAHKYFLPILKDVDIVCLIGSGDPLSSRHIRDFIKLIIKEYPNIKFDLHTNGLLLTEQNLKDLDLVDRLSTIQISIHAAKKETYETIVIGGSWDKLINNLNFISKMRSENKLFSIHLNFVVSNINYKEMKDFVILATNLGAEAFFWNFRNWNTKFSDSNKYKYRLHKMLKDSIFKKDNAHINYYLKHIRHIINKSKVENKINSKIDNIINPLLEDNKILCEEIKTLNKDIKIANNKLYKLINSIAWFIPVKKWRDNFRKKFE